MLVNQVNNKTIRKVKYASWTAAWVAPLSLVMSGILTEALPYDIRQYQMEVSLLLSAIITGAGTWIAGYYTRERI